MMYILPDVWPESELAYQYERQKLARLGYEADTQRMIDNTRTNGLVFALSLDAHVEAVLFPGREFNCKNPRIRS